MPKMRLILDTPYLCYRAFHSTGGLSRGTEATGVVYGVLRDIVKLCAEFRTKNIAFCFDSKHSLRKEVYKEYKANRYKDTKMTVVHSEIGKQIRKLRKHYLPALGFKNVFLQRGYEADDIIASIVQKNTKKLWTIISADADLYQLLTKNVQMYQPGKWTMGQAVFEQEYGIDPKEWVKVKAIAGCSSDNVKGAKGVGEKRALSYLLGELGHETKAYDTINEFVLAGEYHRNLRLVALPYEGTKQVKLQRDNVTKKKWRKLVRHLGIRTVDYSSVWYE